MIILDCLKSKKLLSKPLNIEDHEFEKPHVLKFLICIEIYRFTE